MDSILSQSFPDFELILVDDGSTDNSLRLIKYYAGLDARIIYRSQENCGVSYARNVGISLSCGEYVMFVDSDDYIEKDYLKHILSIVSNNKADILIWSIETVNDTGDVIRKISPLRLGVFSRNDFLRFFVKEQYVTCQGLYGYVGNKLIKRSLLNYYTIKFNEKLSLHEDFDFFLTCYSRARSICCFDDISYKYVSNVSERAYNKKVNYLSLIAIQQKCKRLLNSANVLSWEDEQIIQRTIGLFAQAALLEYMDPCRSDVERIVCFINNNIDVKNAYATLDTKYDILRQLVLSDKKRSVLLYLKVWNLYLKFRKVR